MVALVALAPGAAFAQAPPFAIALRTSGSTMRSGDCVRIDAVALEPLPASLAFRLTYRYREPVTVKDADGRAKTTTRAVEVTRPSSPTIESLDRLQSMRLDDRFCFGAGSLPGAYLIDAVLSYGAGGTVAGVLRTCVVFDDGMAPVSSASCGLWLRGVQRVDASDTLAIDGDVLTDGAYRAVVFRADLPEGTEDTGAYASGAHELIVSSPGLARSAGHPVDVVVFDYASGRSSTLARVSLPRIE
jgi:hypothetical protein